jgi:hypothetical protein
MRDLHCKRFINLDSDRQKANLFPDKNKYKNGKKETVFVVTIKEEIFLTFKWPYGPVQ